MSLWLLGACGSSLQPSTIALDSAFQCRVRIAGQEMALLIDTGAESTSIYADAARRLGLETGPVEGAVVVLTDSSGSEREHREFVKDVSFELGELTCTATAILCLPRAAFASDTRAGVTIARAAEHDGILGMDFLAQMVLWFDAPAGELHVLSTDTVDAFLAEHGRGVAERLTLSGGSRPHVQVGLHGELDIELLLDTGADSTSVPAGTAARLGLDPGDALEKERRERKAAEITQALRDAGLQVTGIEVAEPDGSTVGVHGVPSGPRPLHRLRELRLGGRVVRDLVVVEDESPVLGRDVLATFDWILHGPNRELWLVAPR